MCLMVSCASSSLERRRQLCLHSHQCGHPLNRAAYLYWRDIYLDFLNVLWSPMDSEKIKKKYLGLDSGHCVSALKLSM